MVIAQVYKYAKPFEGVPKKSTFKIAEEDIRPLLDGEFLAEAVYISIDSELKANFDKIEIGSTIMGQQVAVISSSKNKNFPVGSFVWGGFGWRTHTISNGESSEDYWYDWNPYVLPEFADLPKSLALGTLGVPGIIAYFGTTKICDPKPGETLVVSTAAGSVGNVVGQIAKIMSCIVIGITGSYEKGEWLTNELGFDYIINYKEEDLDQRLTEIAPQNIDCYFDNFGGKTSAIVLKHMNRFGRVVVCGLIQEYNNKKREKGYDHFMILSKELRIEGFNASRFMDEWSEGVMKIFDWILNGNIKYKETVSEGFENLVDASLVMWEGNNLGKSILKI